MNIENEARVSVCNEMDVVMARQRGREIAARLGFSKTNTVIIATAISEIARNQVEYAQNGEMRIGVVRDGPRCGIIIIATDQGPGIPDIEKAMQDGFSTSRGLGLGLGGARRLMDEFSVESKLGRGTKVTMKKWL